MLKKMYGLLIITGIIFSLFITVAYASEIVKSGQCSENATWTLDSDGVLTISGTGSMNTSYQSGYGLVKTPWADYTVKKVVINEGITSVQASAFADNKDLESVTLPKTVYYIGFAAFSGCENLKEVNFPEKIIYPQTEYIGALGIYEEVRPSIDHHAFAFCTSLENITIPDGFEKIYYGAFEYCTSLESVVMHEGTTEIGGYAFSGCSLLKNINIPKSVYFIGKEAFKDCSELEKIDISKNVTQVGTDAFDGTKWYENQPDGMIVINGILYGYKGEMPENTEIVISKNITTMLPGVFEGQKNLKSVVIEEGIRCIYEGTFNGCTGLESVKMVDSVNYIEKYAFKNCSSLKNIIFSEKITEIGKFAFSGCKSLESVRLPKNLKYLDRHAFEYCESLKYVELPSGIENINMGTFKGCTSLEKINIPEGIEIIEITAFLNCVNLKEITLPSTLTYIEDPFYNCNNITDIYYNGGENNWKNVRITSTFSSFNKANVHYTYKYFSDTVKIDNNINVADSEEYVGENVMCIFLKGNGITGKSKAVFENGQAELEYIENFDEVWVVVYDKLTSPKFDLHEKIRL